MTVIIKNGQCNYKVTINLKSLLDKEQLKEFKKNFDELKKNKDFNKICKFNREKLEYTSETLLPPPENIDKNKKKLLFILGNPATHSVEMVCFIILKKMRRIGMASGKNYIMLDYWIGN